MTPEQRHIYQFVRKQGHATKKEICEIADHYYANGNKHVGDRLTRMVNAGFLVRVKNGVYRCGVGTKNRPATMPDNQIKLF